MQAMIVLLSHCRLRRWPYATLKVVIDLLKLKPNEVLNFWGKPCVGF